MNIPAWGPLLSLHAKACEDEKQPLTRATKECYSKRSVTIDLYLMTPSQKIMILDLSEKSAGRAREILNESGINPKIGQLLATAVTEDDALEILGNVIRLY